jgi:hypothetical protein
MKEASFFFRNFTLMSSKALIAFFVVLVLTGCFHPVSNMFETAYSLDPGDVRVSVAGCFKSGRSEFSFREFFGGSCGPRTDLEFRHTFPIRKKI